jgi:hypothetical protein
VFAKYSSSFLFYTAELSFAVEARILAEIPLRNPGRLEDKIKVP